MADKLRVFQEIYPPERKATVPHAVVVNDMVYAVWPQRYRPRDGRAVRRPQAPDGDRTAAHAPPAWRKPAAASTTSAALSASVHGSRIGTWSIRCGWMSSRIPTTSPHSKSCSRTCHRASSCASIAWRCWANAARASTFPTCPRTTRRCKIGNLVFTSRCHGNDQATGKIVEGGLEAQARQTFENLATLVKLAGGTRSQHHADHDLRPGARLPARGEAGFRRALFGPEHASTLEPDRQLRLAQHGHSHRSHGRLVGEPDERR